MSDPVGDPWLTLIGLGEDGLGGLSDASRKALEDAEQIFGGERHLALCQAGARGQVWPLPFSVAPVVALRGRPVVVLASGDPFWHGVGGTLARHLDPSEWRCFPAPSCMSLAAARLGWRLETVASLGLHAAPFETLLPHLSNGRRILCTLRDGPTAADIAAWLTAQGFGASELIVMEALGGPHERVRTCTAAQFTLSDVGAPVVVGIAVNGKPGLSQTAGREADIFAHDGQITKGPMRALTLAALAPRAGQRLWDIGAGSGSVSVEWALAAPDARAIAMEPRADRCANIRENAARFGLSHRITIVEGTAPAALADLPVPDAVFIGGGVNAALLSALWDILPAQTRLVANAVTLGSQALLTGWHGQYGGQLLRIDLAQATPLGQMRGWTPSRPQVQWSVLR